MNGSDDFAAHRAAMVEHQLRARGIDDARVIAAIERVPREKFVEPSSMDEAYADRALSIDCEQTISQPYMVGLMSQALALGGSERVLEIGTGSGYQTAVLAELAAHVFSVERHAPLLQQARNVLAKLGYSNVSFASGDGTLGWPSEAPFERILVAAATLAVPPVLVQQLAEAGRMVIPLGAAKSQVLYLLEKRRGKLEYQSLSPCRFVPLVSDETSGATSDGGV